MVPFALSLLAGFALVAAIVRLVDREPPRTRVRYIEVPAAAPSRPAADLEGAGSPLDVLEARLGRRGEPRLVAALALLHAADGNEAAATRLLHDALGSGVDGDLVLHVVRALSADRRAPLLRELLARHPDADLEPETTARILATGGAPDAAIEVLARALRGDDEPDVELAAALLALDGDGGATLLRDHPMAAAWDADQLQSVVGVLAASGRDDAALALVLRALDGEEADLDRVAVLARLDPEAATDLLQMHLRRDPSDTRAWRHLGRLRRAAGDPAGAFDAFAEAAARAPTRRAFRALVEADAARALPLVAAHVDGQADDEAIGLHAHALRGAGELEAARARFLEAHRADPDDREWIEALTDLDASAAVAALEVQLAAAGERPSERLLGQLGDALRAAGREREAFDRFLDAHRADPGDSDWQRRLAELDPARALPVLSAFLAEDPDDASGRGALGLALSARGRAAEAAEAFEEAVARGDPETWHAAYARIDADRALAALESRAQTDDDADVWGVVAEVHATAGRLDEARGAYRRALLREPDEPAWAAALRALR